MYTGHADHWLTAELVERVDVPVMASGDITSRARAQQVLAETGAAAVMIARGSQGNPWLLRELVEGVPAEPTTGEVVDELVRFIREIAREMSEERAVGWLRKFYGWYLQGGRLPKPVKAELAHATTHRRGRGDPPSRGAPGRAARWHASTPTSPRSARIDDDTLLALPISIFAGG